MKKITNIFRWFEFKKEAIVLFANLKRNNRAYKHLDEYTRAVWFFGYILGMLVFAFLRELINWIL